MKRSTILSTLLLWCVLACATLLASSPAQAQEAAPAAEQPVQVILLDGSKLIGTIVSEKADTLHFRTAAGVEMTIPRAQVARIETLSGAVVGGRYLRRDPNATRLFFAPTARSLGGGRGYLALYYIFFPYVSAGVGNVATLGGGISLLPGAEEQLLYGAAKLTVFEQREVALAAGAFAATVTGGREAAGAFFGTATLGGAEAAVTVNVAFAFGGGEVADRPVLQLGGEYQLSNQFKLLSENYVVPGVKDAVVVSLGLRFLAERLSADFGLFAAPTVLDETEGFPLIPWISFSYAFGRQG